MARQDKILDILGLQALPEDVQIARLAHQKIGKPFTMEHARAVIQCYFEPGRYPELTRKLFDEKHRQEATINDRRAFRAVAEERTKSPMRKYKGAQKAEQRRKRMLEIAQETFGDHVRENFNEGALALMSLISQEYRWYRIKWVDAGFKPVRSALIEVTTMSPKGPLYSRFLLYKMGRVLVARTRRGASTVQDAFADQLPPDLVAAAGELQAAGYNFRSDLDDQVMVVTAPDGLGRIVPWTGRTVDE